jgi:hypothetical protein
MQKVDVIMDGTTILCFGLALVPSFFSTVAWTVITGRKFNGMDTPEGVYIFGMVAMFGAWGLAFLGVCAAAMYAPVQSNRISPNSSTGLPQQHSYRLVWRKNA